jgi:hypothetical protein
MSPCAKKLNVISSQIRTEKMARSVSGGNKKWFSIYTAHCLMYWFTFESYLYFTQFTFQLFLTGAILVQSRRASVIMLKYRDHWGASII